MKSLKSKNTIIVGMLAIFAVCGCTYSNNCIAADNSGYNYSINNIRSSIDWDSYIAKARRSVKANWYPPTSSFENAATIVLTISKDGTLQNCYLSNPSPDEGFNQSLIEAAHKAAYPPLPEGYYGKNIDLDLDFSMQKRTISK